jgi:hypothetical protein
MGWKESNGRRYYYRSTNTEGTISTQYCGSGMAAEAAAMGDNQRRLHRQSQYAEDLQYISHVSEGHSVALDAQWWIERLVRADACLSGFLRHNRGSEWRRRHGS